MDEDWSIITGGGSIVVSRICKKTPLVICDRDFSADLIVIGHSAFDVILGMDWLGSTHAIIDYRMRKVIFRLPGQSEFEFRAREVQKTSSLMVLDADD